MYIIMNSVVLKKVKNEKELLNLNFIESKWKKLKKLEKMCSNINLSPKKIVNI